MEKMTMCTMDGAEKNIQKIFELFPECVREVKTPSGALEKKIDFDVLKEILGEHQETKMEAYEFSWAGKREALREAHKSITKTLRPCPGESWDWENTRNLYIEGDNLEVMKMLQKNYLGKVDLIYIDPPYNTGNDFLYKDDFRMKAEEYDKKTGTKDEENIRFFSNNSANGRFHSDWCSMIYSRLLIARSLLSADGAIFISIDDNEVDNLKKICDEVFGESNFVTMFTWVKTMNPPSLGSKVRDNMEYILCYEKRFSAAKKLYGRESNQKDSPLANSSNRENTILIPAGSCDFPGVAKGVIPAEKKKSGVTLLDEVLVEENRNVNAFHVSLHSKWGQENVERETASGTRFVIKDSDYFSIRYIKGRIDYVVPDKFLHYEKFDVKDNEFGRKEVEELLGKVDFSYPKNTPLIVTLLNMYLKEKKSAIVMDFFSGSGTTAHAVMKQNAQDNGNRQFLMIQYPEECREGSLAKAAGYENICEIGKERIRRAAEKIKEETGAEIDYGFRVFRADESNMEDVFFSAQEYSQNRLSFLESNIRADRSALDLFFGCILDWGLPLTLPYTCEEIQGYQVHIYHGGDLVACFEENVPKAVMTEIAKKKPLRAVFRDCCFAGSVEKLNIEEVFRLLSPDTSVKVI